MLDSKWLGDYDEVIIYSKKDDRPIEKPRRYIIYNPSDLVSREQIKDIISDIEFLNSIAGDISYKLDIKNPKHFCITRIKR